MVICLSYEYCYCHNVARPNNGMVYRHSSILIVIVYFFCHYRRSFSFDVIGVGIPCHNMAFTSHMTIGIVLIFKFIAHLSGFCVSSMY